MTMTPFTACVQSRANGKPISVVSLAGRLDVSGLPVFQEQLLSIGPIHGLRVVFDLGDLTFIGSAGIGLFLSFVEELREAGGDARFVNVPSGILSILMLLNVLEFLTQSGSEDEAIAELSA